MSAVRMCDRCGTVFSERSEDWGTFQGTTMRRDPDTGRRTQVTESLDICGTCNTTQPTAPAAIETVPGVAAAERLADIHAGQPAERRPTMIGGHNID